MHEKELFDETLDINSTNNYEISIQLGLNGFSFSLLDKLRNKFIMFRDYKLSGNETGLAAEIEKIISGDEFLKRPYYKYRIVFNLEQSTIVPSSLFDPAVKNEYFELNHKLHSDHIVSNNKLGFPDAYLLFSIRKDIFDLSCSRFPEASLSHQVKPLLDSSFRSATKNKDRYIRVHFDQGFFTLILIDNENLQFCNTFRTRNDSDVLYFLLNCLNRFNVPGDHPVYISGNINKFDDLYNNMLRYISTLKLAAPHNDYSLSYIFDGINTHQYCNLFNIINCA